MSAPRLPSYPAVLLSPLLPSISLSLFLSFSLSLFSISPYVSRSLALSFCLSIPPFLPLSLPCSPFLSQSHDEYLKIKIRV